MQWNLSLSDGGATPKYQQLVDHVEASLRRRALRPGERLPSVAELARLLDISKPTVVQAYRELESRGLLVTAIGRGSFIAEDLPRDAPADPALPRVDTPDPMRDAVRHRLHRDTSQHLLSLPLPSGGIDLRIATPPILEAAQDHFRSAATRASQLPLAELFGYAERGHPEFLTAICRWHRERGLDIEPDQVLVTNGAQGAIALVSHWCALDGRMIGHESPTCLSFPLAMRLYGLDPVEVDLRRGELSAPDLEALASEPSLFYCVPDFQNPTGATFDGALRGRLAALAESSDLIIATDEIFRELRFAGADEPSLFGMLPRGRRILVNSFSKTFVPGLRAGYLVADKELVDDLLSLRRELDLGCPSLTQATMAIALEEGLDAVITSARAHYRVRHDALVEALAENLPDGAWFAPPGGGYHLWLELPEGCSATALYLRLLGEGIAVRPGPTLDIDGRCDNAVRLSYGHATPDELRRAAGAICAAIESLAGEGARGRDAASPAVLY